MKHKSISFTLFALFTFFSSISAKECVNNNPFYPIKWGESSNERVTAMAIV